LQGETLQACKVLPCKTPISPKLSKQKTQAGNKPNSVRPAGFGGIEQPFIWTVNYFTASSGLLLPSAKCGGFNLASNKDLAVSPLYFYRIRPASRKATQGGFFFSEKSVTVRTSHYGAYLKTLFGGNSFLSTAKLKNLVNAL
jgi:hypothetical protein